MEAIDGCLQVVGGIVAGHCARREPITHVRADGVDHLPRRADGSAIVRLLDEAGGLGGYCEGTLSNSHL
jgi:hypothetical protein